MSQPTLDPFAQSEALAAGLVGSAEAEGVQRNSLTGTILSVLTKLSAEPNSAFPSPPTYRQDLPGAAFGDAKPVVASSHTFFDVVKARASRRDFGITPLPATTLTSLLAWTFGQRDHTIAYDWRDAPLRYCSSAGGLASVDAYCVALNVEGLENGSYYFDFERGLVQQFGGQMATRLAGLLPGTTWLERASALVVLVANPDRVDHKYQAMGAKLSMLDAGVAMGHLELVATALEMRSCVLGSLPAEILAELLCLGDEQLPLVSLAVGTRA